ncbi:MAG: phage portal protein [Phycisphaerales bacterium]
MPDRLGTERGLDDALIRVAIEEHEKAVAPRLEELWRYFRNPAEPVGAEGGSSRGWRLAQEAGLPARVTGRSSGLGEDAFSLDDRARTRREVVIENDIAWRVLTMVDFLFGRPVRIASEASDAGLAADVERVLDAVWEASGGLALLQDVALLGHVYGHVDLAVRVDEGALAELAGEDPAVVAAHAIRIEPIEATRGVPILSAGDYRRLDGYLVHFERELNEVERTDRAGRAKRLFGRERANGRASSRLQRKRGTVTEVFEPGRWRRVEDGEVVAERASSLLPDVVPVVHVQNGSQPFRYSGLSEVEALIPLQDELNTRLSDRASRVTMQSFRMYLAKGLDGFDRVPVTPGSVWSTNNPDASIESFGGDGASPSEESHIEQIREAMDKASAVPPLAGGVVRAKVGNLTSANALRITLLSLLAKTARKRVTYGRGIVEASGLVLDALAGAGVLMTGERERGLRVAWPDALPSVPAEDLSAAESKRELGVGDERLLAELGYGSGDPGVV